MSVDEMLAQIDDELRNAGKIGNDESEIEW